MNATGLLPLLHSSIIDLNRTWADRPAVRAGKGALTYSELHDRTVKTAAWLQKSGCRPGDRIAVCLPKSPETVLTILGTLAAGAAYVPIDPNAPVGRALKICANSQPQRIVTYPDMAERIQAESPDGLPPITVLPDLGTGKGMDALLEGDLSRWKAIEAGLDDVAAILYTSGSTGDPKGVMLSHRNISSFVRWTTDTFGLNSEDRMTSHAPFHFDLSTLDLYSTFHVGASVYLLDDKTVKFPAAVSQIVERERITVWYSVPTALRMMLEKGGLAKRDVSSLRLIFFAGEVFPVPALRELMQAVPDVEYVNLYGPTETNVCTYHRLPAVPAQDELAIPIGIPCEHLEVEILGDNRQPVAKGDIGEICVYGPAVMKGYWQKPDAAAGVRLNGREDSYRTGDFGSWSDDGTLRYCGRRDAQVKIRGHRVELMEIESVLVAHPQVKEAAIVLVGLETMEPELVAYIVPRAGGALAIPELLEHCGRFLPAYCKPDRVVLQEDFPRTSTGKIDRQMLRKAAADSTETTFT